MVTTLQAKHLKACDLKAYDLKTGSDSSHMTNHALHTHKISGEHVVLLAHVSELKPASKRSHAVSTCHRTEGQERTRSHGFHLNEQ